MSRLQQVHWELTMDYLGHPYYVSGNAIYHALGRVLDPGTHRTITASHGIFVPGQYGAYPDEHSQSGSRPFMGASLAEVNSYEDLFLFRHPDQSWLLDSRARDALNVHDIRHQNGRPGLAHETIMGRPSDAYRDKQTTHWYVSAYLQADDDVLPLREEFLDGLQFGGKRNYGYGTTRLKDTQVVDLRELDYSGIRTADSYAIELITPFVLRSEYPGAAEVDIPWWWATGDNRRLRRRRERIVEGNDSYTLRTVDHGVVVGYDGNRPIETAKNGVRRVGTHSKYGFGEFRVWPADAVRVSPETGGQTNANRTEGEKS